MLLRQSELWAWEAVAICLHQEQDAEGELLVDIVESHAHAIRGSGNIGAQPGAFDAGLIQLQSAGLYAIAFAAISAVAPKVFDAALDITKDVLKKRLDPTKKATAPCVDSSIDHSVELGRIRACAIEVGRKHKLSLERAERLADALVVSLIAGRQDEVSRKA